MPKPENFDKLTPDQKRKARLEAWINHEGITFTDPEAEKGYRERAQMFADAFEMKKPKRLPVAIATGFVPFLYAGYSCKDAMYDTDVLAKAMMKFHADFLPDTAASAGLYVPGQVLEILDYKLYHWPGHGVPENTSYQCAEAEFMKADEYASYLSDPSDYFIRTYLPRVMGALAPWKDLPPFTDILELPFIPWSTLPFGLPHIQESLKKLMRAGELSLAWAGKVAEIDNAVVTTLGLPKYQGGFSKAPYDVIADTMRGTRAMMLDIFRPDCGEVRLFGGPMSEDKKRRIGYMPEERGLYRDQKLAPTLEYLATLKGLSESEAARRLETWLKRLDLWGDRQKKIQDLSRGMQQKAQLIATLVHEPDLIVVDEPFANLDPVNTRMAIEMLTEQAERGKAIIMSTHLMFQVEAMCHRIVLIDKGRTVLYGTVDQIKRDFSTNAVLVEGQGDFQSLPGVLEARRENSHWHLSLAQGATPQAILRALAEQEGARIERFELAEPSLDDIFINVVKDGASARNGGREASDG